MASYAGKDPTNDAPERSAPSVSVAQGASAPKSWKAGKVVSQEVRKEEHRAAIREKMMKRVSQSEESQQRWFFRYANGIEAELKRMHVAFSTGKLPLGSSVMDPYSKTLFPSTRRLDLLPYQNFHNSFYAIARNSVLCTRHACLSVPSFMLRRQIQGQFVLPGLLEGLAAGSAFFFYGFLVSPLVHLTAGAINTTFGVVSGVTRKYHFDPTRGQYVRSDVKKMAEEAFKNREEFHNLTHIYGSRAPQYSKIHLELYKYGSGLLPHRSEPIQKGDESHYAVLGVNAGATESEIKLAFKALTEKYHPETGTLIQQSDIKANPLLALKQQKQQGRAIDTIGSRRGNKSSEGAADFTNGKATGATIEQQRQLDEDSEEMKLKVTRRWYRIAEAYRILSNPSRRKKYNNSIKGAHYLAAAHLEVASSSKIAETPGGLTHSSSSNSGSTTTSSIGSGLRGVDGDSSLKKTVADAVQQMYGGLPVKELFLGELIRSRYELKSQKHVYLNEPEMLSMLFLEVRRLSVRLAEILDRIILGTPLNVPEIRELPPDVSKMIEHVASTCNGREILFELGHFYAVEADVNFGKANLWEPFEVFRKKGNHVHKVNYEEKIEANKNANETFYLECLAKEYSEIMRYSFYVAHTVSKNVVNDASTSEKHSYRRCQALKALGLAMVKIGSSWFAANSRRSQDANTLVNQIRLSGKSKENNTMPKGYEKLLTAEELILQRKIGPKVAAIDEAIPELSVMKEAVMVRGGISNNTAKRTSSGGTATSSPSGTGKTLSRRPTRPETSKPF